MLKDSAAPAPATSAPATSAPAPAVPEPAPEGYLDCAQDLLSFVGESPSAFHAVSAICARLDAAGFSRLSESQPWVLARGSSYYTVRNGSSVIAFRLGEELDNYHFQLSAAHADSPTYKVKALPELDGPEGSLRLNVEGYGSMIDYSWLDRPLTVAGRVMVRTAAGVESRLAYLDDDVALIPSVAIHMNREVNEGYAFNRRVDLCPLISVGSLGRGAFLDLVAAELGVAAQDILGFELFLANRQRPCIWGAQREFVSAPRLDDLMCAHASLLGFLASQNPHHVSVYVCLDNEEVGSRSKQGAQSTFLRDVLTRINAALGKGQQELLCALAKSFLVSCDNAHAVHPNHPEYADETNRPRLNGGVVIKEHAGQLYTTDAFSRATFVALCQEAGVPLQVFANRSDKRGGSTLGNISSQQVSVHALDVGLAQLAMHSSYETAGAWDSVWAVRALKAFFDADLHIEGAERVSFG